jgi:hypothetical protein
MFRGPRVFLITILVMALVVIGYRFHQYLLSSNFLVLAATACDPVSEACFVWDCDPETDGEECDITPYKKVEVLARHAPQCLLDHSCETFSCEGVEDCSVTYCADDTLEDGEVCAEPVIEEPVLEEEAVESSEEETEETLEEELL